MRTIKFRCKCCHSDAWAYGNLVDYGENECPEIQGFDVFGEGRDVWQEITVERDTVGQFTGLHDKNGKEIYEGDIVQLYDADNKYHYIVYWYEEQACFAGRCIETSLGIAHLYKHNIYRVLGNIYDNPELVNPAAKGGEQ